MSPLNKIKLNRLRSKLDKLDNSLISILKKVYFLLKEQGMTINGVKKLLNNKEPLKLDETSNNSIKANILRNKLSNISEIVKSLKKLK